MGSKSSKVKGKHQGKSSKPTPNQYGEKMNFWFFSETPLFWSGLTKIEKNHPKWPPKAPGILPICFKRLKFLIFEGK